MKNKYHQILSSIQSNNIISSLPIHDGYSGSTSTNQCKYDCDMEFCQILTYATQINMLMYMHHPNESFEVGREIHIDYFNTDEWVVSLYSHGILISDCIPLRHSNHYMKPLGVHRRFFQSPEVVLIAEDRQYPLQLIIKEMVDHIPAYTDVLHKHDIFINYYSPKGIRDTLEQKYGYHHV